MKRTEERSAPVERFPENPLKRYKSPMPYRILAITILLCMPLVARADVYLCNGKWTNQPCPGEEQKTISVSESPTSPSPERKLKREKESVLHELRMKAIEAKRDYGVRFPIDVVENTCEAAETNLEDCGKLVDDAMEKLLARMQTESTVKAQQEQLRLQEEANKLQEERNRLEAEKPARITIIQRVPVVTTTTLPGTVGSSSIAIGASGGGITVNATSQSITTPLTTLPPWSPDPPKQR